MLSSRNGFEMSATIKDSYVLILLIFNNFLVLLKQVLECKLPAVKPAFDTSELYRPSAASTEMT